MARLPRHISKFVRAKALAIFRAEFLPIIRQKTAYYMRQGDKPRAVEVSGWSSFAMHFPMSELRAGVEALNEVPSAAAAERQTKVERLEAELKAWKRTRTVARRKVAQLQRQVRYHRLKEKGVAPSE